MVEVDLVIDNYFEVSIKIKVIVKCGVRFNNFFFVGVLKFFFYGWENGDNYY